MDPWLQNGFVWLHWVIRYLHSPVLRVLPYESFSKETETKAKVHLSKVNPIAYVLLTANFIFVRNLRF